MKTRRQEPDNECFFSAAPRLYLTFSLFTAVHVANVARPSVDAELWTRAFSISR